MKKYKLKEQYKNIVRVPNFEAINTLDYWDKYVLIEALEEVPSRIELIKYTIDPDSKGDLHFLNKLTNKPFSDQEKDLCEKALNGELLDIDSLDEYNFAGWIENIDYSLYIEDQGTCQVWGIKNLLKQYLKQKKKYKCSYGKSCECKTDKDKSTCDLAYKKETMKAKEKAKELVEKYLHLKSNKLSDYSRIEYPTAKKCALIAVDEKINLLKEISKEYNIVDEWFDSVITYAEIELQEVKQEIEKL